MHNFGALIGRVLVEELKYFNLTFEHVVMKHIDHIYSKEMAMKSEVVSPILSPNHTCQL